MVNCGYCGSESFQKAESAIATIKFREHPPVELDNSFNPVTRIYDVRMDAEKCDCGVIYFRNWEVNKTWIVDEAENMRQMVKELA